MGRNTAPAIALAAIDALKQTADAVLLVLPADHVIRDRAAVLGAQLRSEDGVGRGVAALADFGFPPH